LRRWTREIGFFYSFNVRGHGIRYVTHAEIKATARLSIHRGFLQPKTAAFDPWLQIADSVPGKLDQRAASEKNW
jgi:hypothetical protein